jgi:hypothetical protein
VSSVFLSPQVISESESSCALSIACKVSDGAVTSLKKELKAEEDTEEIESDSEETRSVCCFPIHNQHQRFNTSGLLWSQ